MDFSPEMRREVPTLKSVDPIVQAELALLNLHEIDPSLEIDFLNPRANNREVQNLAMREWAELTALYREHVDKHGDEPCDPGNPEHIKKLLNKIRNKETLH